MLRSRLLCKTVLQSLISNVSRTPAYLRHAPPGLYITCDCECTQRHTTLLVDVSLEHQPPFTNGAYLLASTGSEDTSFREARSVLFANPIAHTASEAVYLAENALRTALTRNHMAISLDSIQTLVIAEFHPLIGYAVKELLARLPKLQIACNPLTAAFLSDEEFFKGVAKTLSDNDATISSGAVTFAGIPQANTQIVEDESTISSLGPGRQLQLLSGDLTATRERWRRERKNKLKHFESYALLMQDPAFHAVHVPHSSGVRFPWLPFIVPEVDPAVVLPLPGYFAAQTPNNSSLLEVWRLEEQVHSIVTALKKFPETQRVLTTCYGEVPGGANGYIEQLRQVVQKLEELRSRLGLRLSTDTGRNMEKWSALLSDKILTECLMTRTPTVKTTPEVLSEYKKWANAAFCGRLARTLAHTAVTLPPSPVPSGAPQPKSKPSHSPSPKVSGFAVGVKELKQRFEEQGMGSLCPVLEKEDIDATVFLAMNSEDFKKVFKATFGIVRKMEILQQELRVSLQRSDK